MGINPVVAGVGLGVYTPSFSSLVRQEETSSSNSLPPNIGASIRSDLVGNRLYWDGKFLKLEPKPPAYVAGELLNKVWKAASSALSSFTSGAKQIIASLGFKPASAEGCYLSVLNQFPQMDSASNDIVLNLCENNETERTVYNQQLNPQGVQAIAAALVQNTALRTFSFSNAYCNTETFATAFVSALENNDQLQELDLNLADVNPGPIIPSPMTALAASEIFRNMQCFNLSYLGINPFDLTVSAAQTFEDTFQSHPYFPLKRLALSWRVNSISLDPQIRIIFQGIEKSRCITEFQPATYTQLTPQMMLALFETVGASQTLSSLQLWCTSSYTFTDAERQTILDAVTANLCFLNFTNTVPNYNCFTPDLEEAIRNITRERTPCERDPQCSNFVANCSSGSREPDPTGGNPSSSSSEGITGKMPFRLSLGLAGGALFIAATVWYARRRGWCSREEEIEPGAGSRIVELQSPPPIPQFIPDTTQNLNTLVPSGEGEP